MIGHITGGIWLTVDKEAHAAFFGWVKEVYEAAIWYGFGSNQDESAERKDYYIPSLPNGYETVFSKEKIDGRVEVYRNENGQYLQFHYVWGTAFSGLLGGDDKIKIQITAIYSQPADIVISNDPDISNTIVRKTEDVVFAISGYLNTEELIALAESVERIP